MLPGDGGGYFGGGGGQYVGGCCMMTVVVVDQDSYPQLLLKRDHLVVVDLRGGGQNETNGSFKIDRVSIVKQIVVELQV